MLTSAFSTEDLDSGGSCISKSRAESCVHSACDVKGKIRIKDAFRVSFFMRFLYLLHFADSIKFRRLPKTSVKFS